MESIPVRLLHHERAHELNGRSSLVARPGWMRTRGRAKKQSARMDASSPSNRATHCSQG